MPIAIIMAIASRRSLSLPVIGWVFTILSALAFGNGVVYAGGSFTSIGGATRNRIADLARLGSGSRMTAWYCMGHMQDRFAGIEDPVKREKVLRFMYSGEVSAFAKDAPVVIAVIGTLMEGSVDVPYDLSAAIENICLEAHSLGLGACWVHGPVASTRDAKKFKEILGIPTGLGQYKVIAYVSIGWPAEARKHPRPKKPLEELVYWERFGNKERPRNGS